MEEALEAMVKLIANGMDFSDAQWEVTVDYNLSDHQVRNMVDAYDEIY